MRTLAASILIVLAIAMLGTAWADELRFSPEGTLTNLKETEELKVIIRPIRRAKPMDRSQYTGVITRCASKYGLHPSLIEAVIQAESNWNPDAVSHKGAMGLMQLMPETARLLGVENPFNPSENIEGGTRYLAEMLDTFNGRLDLALAAYNAGPTVVSNLGKIPQNRETPYYVTKVLGVFKAQGGELPDVEDRVARAEATGKSKKPFVAAETVFLCEDERGKPLITNIPVLRGG